MFGWIKKLFKKKKPIERICGNCRMFNYRQSRCNVALLYAGKEFHLPVDPHDDCFFESEFIPLNEKHPDVVEPVGEHLEEVRFWCENPITGEQTREGQVKIEYPEDFFGPKDLS
jgi:hypothetical protein